MSKIQSLKGSLKGLSSRLKIEYSLFKRLDSIKSYKIHLSFRTRQPKRTANCVHPGYNPSHGEAEISTSVSLTPSIDTAMILWE